METGLLDYIMNQVVSQGIWCGLAIFLGWQFKKEIDRERNNSQAREDKLMVQLDKYNDQLERNTAVLQSISEEIKEIKEEIENSKGEK